MQGQQNINIWLWVLYRCGIEDDQLQYAVERVEEKSVASFRDRNVKEMHYWREALCQLCDSAPFQN